MWWLSVFGAVLLLILWILFRDKIRIRVNCWFCNENSSVQWRFRNSWTCPYCDQYNGFTDLGDYNREMVEHYDRSVNPDFGNFHAEPSRPPPDLLPQPNGLCENCNMNQTLKMRQLATFVPTTEANFEWEVEDYRRHLEKAYSLCEKCQQFLDNELKYQQIKLWGRVQEKKTSTPKYKESVAPKVFFSSGKKKQRTMWRDPGVWAKRFHAATLTTALLLFAVSFHHLEDSSDAQLTMFPELLPAPIRTLMIRLERISLFLAAFGLVSHFLSMSFGKARLTFVDFVNLVCWTLISTLHLDLFASGLRRAGYGNEEIVVWRTGLASVAVLASTFVAVLPRKRQRSSQHKFKSCLSLSISGGTPNSQCSASSIADTRFKMPTSPPPRSPGPKKNQRKNSNLKTRDEESVAVDGEMRRGREETPSRELGRGLGALSLGRSRYSAVPRGPFSSMTFPAEVAGSRDPATNRLFTPRNTSNKKSVLAPPRFHVPSSTLPGQDSLSQCSESAFTSVSQRGFRDNNALYGDNLSLAETRSISESAVKSEKWLKFGFAIVVALSLSTNFAVLYYVIFKTS